MSREDRRELWEKKAREFLGDIADNALVKQLLFWIDDDGLGASLEVCGLIKSYTGTLVTTEQMTNEVLGILKRNMGDK